MAGCLLFESPIQQMERALAIGLVQWNTSVQEAAFYDKKQ